MCFSLFRTDREISASITKLHFNESMRSESLKSKQEAEQDEFTKRFRLAAAAAVATATAKVKQQQLSSTPPLGPMSPVVQPPYLVQRGGGSIPYDETPHEKLIKQFICGR